LKVSEEEKKWLDFIELCRPDKVGTKRSGSADFELLAGDGSTRRFYRVRGTGFRAVLMVNPEAPANSAGTVDENDSFVYLAGLLRRVRAGAPEVYGYQREEGLVLMEDVGDNRLQERILAEGTDSDWTEKTYCRLLDLLLVVQFEGEALFEPARVFNPTYDADFMFEAEGLYFAEYFVERHCGVKADKLRQELRWLADRAAETIGRLVLVCRDFQSRNIFLDRKEKFRLLDFQGARLGPPTYDPASLIYDPYVALPDRLRTVLVRYYHKKLAERSAETAEGFLRQFPLIAAHRLMQALGAYAKLSLVDGKEYFLRHVPVALADLRQLISSETFDDFTWLRAEVNKLEPAV
jgi:aminoglycoside/choline kinase family phosphotransferase